MESDRSDPVLGPNTPEVHNMVVFPASAQNEQLFPSRAHLIIGIIQICIGNLMIVTGVVTVFTLSAAPTIGVGIYCGVPILVSGIFSILTALKSTYSTKFLVTCMILNIVSSVLCGIGFTLAYIQAMVFHFSTIKYFSIFWLIFCLGEMVLTIVHASLICRSNCQCCRPINSYHYQLSDVGTMNQQPQTSIATSGVMPMPQFPQTENSFPQQTQLQQSRTETRKPGPHDGVPSIAYQRFSD